jgi:hypothetical protein
LNDCWTYFGKGTTKYHPCQVCFNLVQWFHMRGFTCESLRGPSFIVYSCFVISKKNSSTFNCSYMALCSSTYLPGFLWIFFSANNAYYENKNHIKIFCSEIWAEMIFGWPTVIMFDKVPSQIWFNLVQLFQRRFKWDILLKYA